VCEHGETDAHQTCNQVAGDGGGGVVENFVLGLDFTDVTMQVTDQAAGNLFGDGIPFCTPVHAAQDFWISDGRTKGV
jgi:hypothetical protein